VHVRREHRAGDVGTGRNGVGGPGGAVAGRVLVPGDLVVVDGGGQGVGVAVPVHVRRIRRKGAVGGGGDCVRGPGAAVARRVLVPVLLAPGLGICPYAALSGPVHVRREHRAGPVGTGGDGVRRPGAAVACRVLVPGDLVVVGGGRQHVGVAVAVHVR